MNISNTTERKVTHDDLDTLAEYELVRCSVGGEDISIPNVFAKNENEALELFASSADDGADGTKSWFFDSFCAVKCGEE